MAVRFPLDADIPWAYIKCMSKHTPGPWTAQDCQVISNASPISVCIVWDRKDAPLIAAAPDLLEALRMIYEALASSSSAPDRADIKAMDKAEAAIAKAEGQ